MSNIFDFFSGIFYFYKKGIKGFKMFIDISQNLKNLAKYFPENLYVVGGYVRNKLLKIDNSDVDLASSVDIEEVEKRLEGSPYSVRVKNQKCGTIVISRGIEKYEYTAFRKDIYSENGSHTPISIQSTQHIEEDAARRDFTINSIYYNINRDEVFDLYHGIIDLNDGIIRCNLDPEEVLRYDGERILRMVRIAGELDFKIDKDTLSAAKKFNHNLGQITGARKFVEIEKILYCDKRYRLNSGSLKRALSLLNVLGVWKYFELNISKIKYDMVFKAEDRFLGLLIDIVNTQKPKCLEAFLDTLLKCQFGISQALSNKIFIFLAGYYDALGGMKNKEYFLKYYEDWAGIYALLGCKSKRIQSKYHFFYQYIIEHGLSIQVSDLRIDERDIKKCFKNIDKRSYKKILQNLLSKVFDGKIANQKEELLAEIEKNLQNY